MSAEIEEVVKILDKRTDPPHTFATLVRNTHWGVTRGSDSTLGQGFEHLTSLCFHLTPVKNFSILKEAHRLTLLVSAHYPLSLPPPKAVLPHVVRLSSRLGGLSHSVLSIPQRRQAGGKAHDAGIRLRPRRERRLRFQEGHWSLTLPTSEFGLCSCGFLVYPHESASNSKTSESTKRQ